MELEIVEVIRKWMEGEVNNFIKVWLSVFASLCFVYYLSKTIPKGPLRFLATVPVICLNLFLPLNLDSIHLGGATILFLVWLSNFKLLMFAFGKGPLSESSLPISRFVAVACFPIRIHKNPHQFIKDTKNPSPFESSQKGLKSIWNYGVKLILIPLFFKVYDYSEHLHSWLTMTIISLHLYIGLEIILAIFGGLARSVLSIELEPQFDDPYLSTSLQDFWGRTWNLMVPRILCPSVYEPVLDFSTRIMGRKWAPLPAIFSTFIVSAIMHEVVLFYLGRGRPTWEMSYFFLLHGAALVVEVAVKKALMKNGHRPGLPWIVSAPLTFGFVLATGFWLFFPEFLRCRPLDRAYKEYAAMAAFARDVGTALHFKSFTAP